LGDPVITRFAGEDPADWEHALTEAERVLSVGATTATTLALVKAIGANTPLWTLTRGAVRAVEADTVPNPVQAGVWGLGRVAALEAPDRWGGLVDLPDNPTDADWAVLPAALVDQAAIRDGQVLVPRLAVVPANAVTTPQITGTVLITGGLGGLGAQVARRLAELGAEHLLLTGRRGAETPAAQELRAELTANGTEVTIVAADVADRDALAALLADHRLTGVVHAAGVLDDGVLDALTPQRLDTVFAAKVGGALNLDDLTRDHPLDFFVLFSSLAGTVGSPGQGNYSAANAVLDALAHRRHARGLPATSLAWGPWAGAGMAEDLAAQLRSRGVMPMSADTALDAFERSLAIGGPVYVAAEVDWPRFAATHTATRLFERLPGVAPASAAEPERPDLTALSTEERGRYLERLVVRHVVAVSGHTVEAITASRSFRELGLDSLAGVRLRNRLSADTGVALPTTVVYEYATPAALARHLDDSLGGSAGDVRAAVARLHDLETALAALRPRVGRDDAVTGLLERILGTWRAGDAAATPQWDLETATDDEIFSLIDGAPADEITPTAGT
jgi:NAD(P)-dependent dehydrogenase (short-subunit alcohol dehydrogenase family)/acyl carrier protein